MYIFVHIFTPVRFVYYRMLSWTSKIFWISIRCCVQRQYAKHQQMMVVARKSKETMVIKMITMKTKRSQLKWISIVRYNWRTTLWMVSHTLYCIEIIFTFSVQDVFWLAYKFLPLVNALLRRATIFCVSYWEQLEMIEKKFDQLKH